eukprot:g1960.t1
MVEGSIRGARIRDDVRNNSKVFLKALRHRWDEADRPVPEELKAFMAQVVGNAEGYFSAYQVGLWSGRLQGAAGAAVSSPSPSDTQRPHLSGPQRGSSLIESSSTPRPVRKSLAKRQEKRFLRNEKEVEALVFPESVPDVNRLLAACKRIQQRKEQAKEQKDQESESASPRQQVAARIELQTPVEALVFPESVPDVDQLLAACRRIQQRKEQVKKQKAQESESASPRQQVAARIELQTPRGKFRKRAESPAFATAWLHSTATAMLAQRDDVGRMLKALETAFKELKTEGGCLNSTHLDSQASLLRKDCIIRSGQKILLPVYHRKRVVQNGLASCKKAIRSALEAAHSHVAKIHWSKKAILSSLEAAHSHVAKMHGSKKAILSSLEAAPSHVAKMHGYITLSKFSLVDSTATCWLEKLTSDVLMTVSHKLKDDIMIFDVSAYNCTLTDQHHPG